MKFSNELKTGAAVFAALVLLVGILYETGDLNIAKKGYVAVTRFGIAAGVKKFAPVRLSGVEVGEVRDIKLVYDQNKTIVEIYLWIEEGVKLRRDSVAMVNTLGLMGEKYVEINAGTAPAFISAGDMIQGKDPVTMDELMETFKAVGNNLNDTLGDVRKLAGNIDSVVADNKEKLTRIVDNIEETSDYFVEFALDVKLHPWKVLSKGKEKTPEEMAAMRAEWRGEKHMSNETPQPAKPSGAEAASEGENKPEGDEKAEQSNIVSRKHHR